MKKQFFYAAFALSMMASCTSEDVVNPVEPTPEDSRVAIELGIDAPTLNATVNSRAVGAVGGTGVGDNETNEWNGQQLNIIMTNKDGKLVDESGNVVTESTTPALGYNTYNYYAPTGSDKGSILIYDKTETNNNSEPLKKNVYYPVNGTYDFYGWHVDDITTAIPNTDNPLLIEGIKITGKEDIMGARTKEFNETNYAEYTGSDFTEMIGWDFSARTARNGIKPSLVFEHQLARLKFFVRAGSEKTIKNHANVDNAMYVTDITVLKMVDELTMNLDKDNAIFTDIKANETADATFKLETRGQDGKMTGSLTAVAPTAVYDKDDEDTHGEQIGESIMFFPYGESVNAVEFSISLKQKVEIYKDGDNTAYVENYWDDKEQTKTLKIHANSVITDTEGNRATAFEAGHSYNVYITVYGYEQIEVSAELDAWDMGGDVDVDIEEGESKHNVDVQFNIVDEEGDPISNATIVVKKHINAEHTNDETIQPDESGKYNVESFSILHYEVSAPEYETVTGITNAGNGNTVTITLKSNTTNDDDDSDDTILFTATATFTDNATGVTVTYTAVPTTEGETVTSTDGNLNLVVGKTYTITATAEDYTSNPQTVTVEEGDQNTTLTFEFTPDNTGD